MASVALPIYRRRRPERTDLYQAVELNLNLFFDLYDERFLTQHGPLTSQAQKTLSGFLECGRLFAGLARLRCDDCGRGGVIAFSCQRRGVCPSCQQKRAEILCGFLEEEVLEPVDHRQLVFVVPKMFRRLFLRDREMMRGLCRAAQNATETFYRTALGCDDVRPGLITIPQLFGDALNPHAHLHSLVTDGAFSEDGQFHQLLYDTQSDISVLQKLFAREVLDFLVAKGRLSQTLRDDMLTKWTHTGFSVDASVRVLAGDRGRLRRLVRYLARPAVSFERVLYDDRKGQVTVLSAKKRYGERPVVAQYDVLTFLALLTLQVPSKGTHMVRYFGWYSTRSRAKRRKAAKATNAAGASSAIEVVPSPKAKERRRRWAELIRQVFEVDPLACPCGGRMRIVSFITAAQPDVLTPPLWWQLQQAQEHVEANAHVYGDDDGHGGGGWSSGEWENA
jgi:hypothetical protein